MSENKKPGPNFLLRLQTVASAIGRHLLGHRAPFPLPPPVDVTRSEKSPSALSEEQIQSLQQQVHYPFNDRNVIISSFQLAEMLWPRLQEYDAVISEGGGGWLPSQLYYHMINACRKANGLEPATLHLARRLPRLQPGPIDNLEPPRNAHSRALIVTEVMSSGASAQAAYESVASTRDRDTIDIVTFDLVGGDALKLFAGVNIYRIPNQEGSTAPTAQASMRFHFAENDVKGLEEQSSTGTSKAITGFIEPQPELARRAQEDARQIGEAFYALLAQRQSHD